MHLKISFLAAVRSWNAPRKFVRCPLAMAVFAFVFAANSYLESSVSAQQVEGTSTQSNQKSGDDSPMEKIAAIVGNQPIYISEVERELARIGGANKAPEATKKVLRAATLERLVSRELIRIYFREKKFLPNDVQMKVKMDLLVGELKRNNTTLDEYLVKESMTKKQLYDSMQWKEGWRKYLDNYLTDENFERFFARNAADFDGRKIKVSQILLKAKSDKEKAEMEAKLLELKKSIEAGTTSFAEAAKANSQSESGKTGGGLGWIERKYPMPKYFNEVAFKLKQGQISAPVRSPLGVHLIRCDEIQKGGKTWQDCKAELSKSIGVFLFDWTANRQRPNSKVKYMPGVDHLNRSKN